jgi:hypothetical protein
MKIYYSLLALAVSAAAQSTALQGEVQACDDSFSRKLDPKIIETECPGAMELFSARLNSTMLVKRLNDFCAYRCRSVVKNALKAAECTPMAKKLLSIKYETNFVFTCTAMDGKYCALHFSDRVKDYQFGTIRDYVANPGYCHPCLKNSHDTSVKVQKAFAALTGQPSLDQVEQATKTELDQVIKSCGTASLDTTGKRFRSITWLTRPPLQPQSPLP